MSRPSRLAIASPMLKGRTRLAAAMVLAGLTITACAAAPTQSQALMSVGRQIGQQIGKSGDDVVRALQGRYRGLSDDAIASLAARSSDMYGDAASRFGLRTGDLLDATCHVVDLAGRDSDLTERGIRELLARWNRDRGVLNDGGLERLGGELTAATVALPDGSIAAGLDVLGVGCDLASE